METALSLKNVSVSYGNLKALDNVSFEIEGGAVGLLGPNGAGKTTLIKAMLNLVPASTGTITVMGNDSRRLGAALRDRVGYVPERDGARPGMSGVAWVALLGEISGLPRRSAVERAHEVLQYVGLEESRYRNVETFSTGMRQRLKLAAALIHDPILLFLDEPTSGMDPVGREEMLSLCRDLANKGKTVLLSTHILKDVEALCAKVVILNKGRILAGASIEEWTNGEAQHFLVQWEGPKGAFEKICAERGWEAELRKDGLIKLVLPPGEKPRAVFEAASSAYGVINRFVREVTSLEELFLTALHNHGDSHAGL